MRIILTLLLAATAMNAAAATYYVATNGNDANNGTQSAPLLTIGEAVDRVAAGDTVYVASGTYNEAVYIADKAGQSGSIIRFAGYGTTLPVIDAAGKSASAAVGIARSSYILFENFEVKNGAMGIYVRDSHHVEIRDNQVHDCTSNGIYAATASASAFGTTNNVTIAENSVYHCVLSNLNGAAQDWAQGISALRATDVKIVDNYVYENWGEGIDYILSDNGLISGNKVWDNWTANVYLDNAQGTVVDKNFISCANSTYYRDGAPAAGIATANEEYDVPNPLDELTISNNVVTRCESGFYYRDSEDGGGLHDTVVAHNVFYNTTYALIWIKDAEDGSHVHSNVLVANNIFYQKYGKPYASSATVGITYQYNNWYGGGDAQTIIQGSNDVLQDPKLVDAGGGDREDYMLLSTSPLRDTGTTTSVTKDAFGVTRAGRGTAYDIGIHEY
ncbi:MAG TPA: right-handed parallel beta-helix repeat-containing protein [Thermoanaerobaculia bacterium]|nr:right-handed parallel beta-helix repeat-containing protein [Thermoanaerobaculia bacterium]